VRRAHVCWSGLFLCDAHRAPHEREVDGLKLDDVYEGMGQTVRKGFRVDRVFGEPVKIGDNITIIPVAKVKMSGGGGGGESEEPGPAEEGKEANAKKAKGGGAGFGFGGGVQPVGYIRIKGDCVKWVRIHDWENIARSLVPVAIVCLIIAKKKMAHMGPMKMGYHHQAMGPHHHKMMHGGGYGHGPGHMHHHGHGPGHGPCHEHMHEHHHGPMEHKKKMMMYKGGRAMGGPCPRCGMQHSGMHCP